MNNLSGKIKWSKGGKGDTIELKDNYAYGRIFELYAERISIANNDKESIYYDKKKSLICAITGYISNINQIKTKYKIKDKIYPAIVAILYLKLNERIVEKIEGMFSICILDLKKQIAIIFQDRYASNLPLYFYSDENQFIFSTSLKWALKKIPMKRELNRDCIPAFLFFQVCIPNEMTLVKNIYKIPPDNYILLDLAKEAYELVKSNVSLPKVSLSYAKRHLLDSVSDNITALYSEINQFIPLALTLSRGYDTNYILNCIRRLTSRRISAFTVGGLMRNEIPQASQIIKQYKDVTHITKIVKSDIMDNFPDIVWRYEGYTIERGVFLQYLLGKTLRQMDYSAIFLGDGADQILAPTSRFFQYILKAYRENNKKILRVIFNYGFNFILSKRNKKQYNNIKYSVDLDYIIKKSGIMLNSFDVQGMYPYINPKTEVFGASLGHVNAFKEYSNRQVLKLLPGGISNIIKKVGGSTDSAYILKDNFRRILKLIIGFQKKYNLVDDKIIEKIINKPEDIFSSEHSLSFILRLLYLGLFFELFISGDFDKYFRSPGIKYNLSYFLNRLSKGRKAVM